jgi:hypothetical protein
MDVKQYFRKIREIEASLPEEFPIVVSIETGDGGRAGILSEVARWNAARMIVEGRAVLATPDQIDEYRAQQAAARKAAEKAEMAKRIQVAIVTDSDLAPSLGSKRGVLTPGGK